MFLFPYIGTTTNGIQSGRIRGGSTKNAHHIAHRDMSQFAEQKGHERTPPPI